MTRLIPNRTAAVDAGLLAVLGALALLGFRQTFTGSAYLLIGLAGLLLGIVVTHAVRVFDQPVIGAVAAVIAAFFIGGALLVPGGSPLRIGTYNALARDAVFSWKQLLTTYPPVAPHDPLIVVPFTLGLLCGAVGYLLAQSLPAPRKTDGLPATLIAAAPVAVPVATLAAVIAFGTHTPGAQIPDGVAVAVLSLCWLSVRRARLRPLSAAGAGTVARIATSAMVLVVAVVIAIFAAPQVPGVAADRAVLRDHVTPPFDIGVYPSPLVGYRKYTLDANTLYNQTLFTVTGLKSGATVRIASLDDYDGSVWGATSGAADGSYQRVGPRFADSGAGVVTIHVTISPAYAVVADLNPWLPTAGTPIGVDFVGSHAAALAGSLRFNLAASSGVVTARLQAGDSYALQTVLSSPTLPSDAQPYGQPHLTNDAAALLGDRIGTWTNGATGLNAQLTAVAQYLHSTGAYSDGGKGEGEYLPGHSIFRLNEFLNSAQPVGDDEQYAAAYALIANHLGIPARVVFGAVPEAGGIVRGQDIHAWVEVHVADGSWVAIPQTQFMPPTTKSPDLQPPPATAKAKQAPVPPPGVAHRPQSVTDASAAQPQIKIREHNPSIIGRVLHVLAVIAVWAGPPLLLLGLIVGGIVGWKVRRRRRRRSTGPIPNRIAGGWLELIDRARDAGIVVPGGVTRQAEAAILAERDVDPRLRDGVEATVPAPRTGAEVLEPDLVGIGAGAATQRRGGRPSDATVRRPARVAADTLHDPATRLTREIRDLANDADRAVFGSGEPSAEAVAAYWDRIDKARSEFIKHRGPWHRLRALLSTRSLRRPVPGRARAFGGATS